MYIRELSVNMTASLSVSQSYFYRDINNIKFMNRIIISIEVQDNGAKEANIIVRSERNNQIMFEEHFEYKDE